MRFVDYLKTKVGSGPQALGEQAQKWRLAIRATGGPVANVADEASFTFYVENQFPRRRGRPSIEAIGRSELVAEMGGSLSEVGDWLDISRRHAARLRRLARSSG
jgi:hypothetical protein